jgi:hypothetical protein
VLVQETACTQSTDYSQIAIGVDSGTVGSALLEPDNKATIPGHKASTGAAQEVSLALELQGIAAAHCEATAGAVDRTLGDRGSSMLLSRFEEVPGCDDDGTYCSRPTVVAPSADDLESDSDLKCCRDKAQAAVGPTEFAPCCKNKRKIRENKACCTRSMNVELGESCNSGMGSWTCSSSSSTTECCNGMYFNTLSLPVRPSWSHN